jgi:hypothetical protein
MNAIKYLMIPIANTKAHRKSSQTLKPSVKLVEVVGFSVECRAIRMRNNSSQNKVRKAHDDERKILTLSSC